jgi:hypothetical protein
MVFFADFDFRVAARCVSRLCGLAASFAQSCATVPEPNTFKKHRNMLPSVDDRAIPERDVLDPETIRILVDAYNKAWDDLRTLKNNPATDEALALMLIFL